MARSNRVDSVLIRVMRVVSHINHKAEQERREHNKQAIRKLLVEPDIKAALPLIVAFGGWDNADKMAEGLEFRGLSNPLILKRLRKHGWQDRYASEEEWGWESTRMTLLSTALQTTTKKIWTDLHSPLRGFLESVDRIDNLKDLEKVVDHFLKDLE